jgi:hypothetical protein
MTRTLAKLTLVSLFVFAGSGAAAAIEAGAAPPTFQGSLSAQVQRPRRVAASPSGRLAVIDGEARLHLLTKRGGHIGVVLEGARAVTAGVGRFFVVNDRTELVTLDEQLGKVLGRASLGLGSAPAGMAYDSVRDVIWMAFDSGMVQARRPDGSIAKQFPASATGLLYRLVDVAVDAEAGIVWVAQGMKGPGGMVFGLNASDGTRVKAIGSATGPVNLAGAMSIDGGFLYAADLFAGNVQVLGADGTVVQAVGNSAAGVGEMPRPAGLAFMSNGDLVVSSLAADRLDRYGSGADLPTCDGDADCDGMMDEWEASHGLAVEDAADSILDADGDGLQNLTEFAMGTNPNAADTDGDGVSDGEEVATGYDPLDAKDHDPVVVASEGAEYAPGRVSLSASVSNVMEGDTCRAAWVQTGGAPVVLTDAEGFAPAFVARAAGAYGFRVVATCGRFVSAPAAASVTVLNLAPVADAPRTTVVELGEGVTLSARRSSDANGDALGFVWEQLSGRAVAGVSAQGAISPHFYEPGSYAFRVTVSDRAGASSAAEVQVVAVGSRPVAAAAVVSPITGFVGQPLALDASASYRHDDAVFSWRQVSGPAVALSNANSAVAGFVPEAPGRYAFDVTIRQSNTTSPAATAEVFVGVPDVALPVAVASAPSVASVGETISLDGAASTSSAGSLEFAWRQVSGPAAGLGSSRAATASAYLFAPGSYEFELTVADAAAVGVPARVRVEARADGRAIPVASVRAPPAAHVGEQVRLDGSASTQARHFRWTQLAGPWVLLEDDDVETFRPTRAGTYVFELEVDDGQVRSAPARVSVVVTDDGMEN